jgi:hypothetical protein
MSGPRNSFPDHIVYEAGKEKKKKVVIEGKIEGTPEEVLTALEEIIFNLRRAYNITRPSATGPR